MFPSLIEIGSKTAEKNSAQTNKQTDKQTDRQTNRHHANNGHLAVKQHFTSMDSVRDRTNLIQTLKASVSRQQATSQSKQKIKCNKI